MRGEQSELLFGSPPQSGKSEARFAALAPPHPPSGHLRPQAGEGLWSTCGVQARARGCSPSHKNIAICLTSAEGLRVPREQPLRRLALGVLDLAHERIRIAKLLERRHAPPPEPLQPAPPANLQIGKASVRASMW